MKRFDHDTKFVGVAIAVLFVTMFNAIAGASLAVTALIIYLLHYLRHHHGVSRDKRFLVIAAIAALLAVGVVLALRAIGA